MEFKDRVANKPNRVKLTFEDSGASNYAIVELADEPIEEGTPLNKKTFSKLVDKEELKEKISPLVDKKELEERISPLVDKEEFEERMFPLEYHQITEKASIGMWYYEKRSDGFLKLYGRTTTATSSETFADGNVFRSSNNRFPFPVAFTEIYYLNGSVTGVDWAAWLGQIYVNDNAIFTDVFFTQKFAGLTPININFEVVGRWK